MAYFAIYAKDRPGTAALREKLRPGHRERLRKQSPQIAVHHGGPLLDPNGAMIGTLLIVEAPDANRVRSWFEGDPYVQGDLYQSVEITPFQWGLGRPEHSDA